MLEKTEAILKQLEQVKSELTRLWADPYNEHDKQTLDALESVRKACRELSKITYDLINKK